MHGDGEGVSATSSTRNSIQYELKATITYMKYLDVINHVEGIHDIRLRKFTGAVIW